MFWFGENDVLKKLALDQTKTYEKHLALEEVSKMLIAFVKGLPHHLAIGAEQGDIDKWDDLVIQTNTGGYIHVQAKRQLTDFSLDSITRGKYGKSSKTRKGELKDLSPLDETLKSLGDRIRDEGGQIDPQKEFWFVLPEGSIGIKKGLEFRHLRKLCEIQIRSITTADALDKLAQEDPNVTKIYEWLTTWCGFEDWEHILNAFKTLKIKTSGMESDIVDRVKNNLNEIFISTDIETVRSSILSYLDDNATFAGAIRPRQLLYLLKGYLRPEIPRWTQFQIDGASWNVSGIHDLENNSVIERPSVVVPALWASNNQNARFLKIDGACIDNCHISKSLMRLSLHPRGSFDILCSDKSSWENAIKIKTGGTLGVAQTDLNDLRILNRPESSSPSESRKFTEIEAQETLAKELHDEMYKTTLELVDSAIMDKIREMPGSDLRVEVEKGWGVWRISLRDSVEEQRKLFSKMLRPKAEGESISGELRVGPKTVDLLKESLFLLLVVSVCMSDDDNKNSWESVADNLKMTSVGLAYWSGPAGGPNRIIKIDHESGLSQLLENERNQIIIIAESTLTDGQVFKDDISGDIDKVALLAHPKCPRLLVTQNPIFNRILERGDIVKLRQYFQNSLDEYNKSRVDGVKYVSRGH